MNSKSLIRWLLLAFVAGSVAVYALRQARADTDRAPDPGVTSSEPVPADVVVTYFTTDVRCPSCLRIESLARRAIEEGFPAELASGAVVFRVLNTDQPEHRHFLEDYRLTNKTVIVSRQVEGREAEWTDRQDVWLLLHEPDRFIDYVREPVKRYLGES